MATLVAVDALPRHLRPQDAWEREITDVAFGRRGGGGPHLNPQRCVRAPSDREPLDVRRDAITAGNRLVDARSLESLRRPGANTLAHGPRKRTRLAFLAGSMKPSRPRADYRAAVRLAAMRAPPARLRGRARRAARRGPRFLEPACGWRGARLALLDGWRSTAGEVCPARCARGQVARSHRQAHWKRSARCARAPGVRSRSPSRPGVRSRARFDRERI